MGKQVRLALTTWQISLHFLIHPDDQFEAGDEQLATYSGKGWCPREPPPRRAPLRSPALMPNLFRPNDHSEARRDAHKPCARSESPQNYTSNVLNIAQTRPEAVLGAPTISLDGFLRHAFQAAVGSKGNTVATKSQVEIRLPPADRSHVNSTGHFTC